MTFVAFHYLTLLVRCEKIGAHINYLYLFLKSTYWEYILEKKISTSEVGPILALIAPSPLSYQLINSNFSYQLINSNLSYQLINTNFSYKIEFYFTNQFACVILINKKNFISPFTKRFLKFFNSVSLMSHTIKTFLL